MKRFMVNTACALAALSFLATVASAACQDSPRVKAQPTLLKQCKAANVKMHKTCDNIPACGGGGYPAKVKRKFVSKIQICIDSRRSITKTWFAGTSDAGHDTAIDNKINQLNSCLR
jgi:hypothetical protein